MSSIAMKSVEELKREGNEFFKKKQWKEAIERYSKAILKISPSATKRKGGAMTNEDDFMKAALLSNRSLCYLYQFDNHSRGGLKQQQQQDDDIGVKILEDVIGDTSLSLDILKALKSTNTTNDTDVRSLRAKILYRRAKANYAMSQSYMNIIKVHCTSSSSSSSHLQQLLQQNQQCKVKAVQDLHDLLSFDPGNKPAQSLLITIQQEQQKQHNDQGDKEENYLNHLMMASSSSTTPVKKSLSIVCQYYFDCIAENQDLNNQNDSSDGDKMMVKVIQSLQFLYSSFVDDLISTSQEVLSYQTSITSSETKIQGLQVLYNLAFRYCQDTHEQVQQIPKSKHNHLQCQSLSIQILKEASMYLPIMHMVNEYHSQQLLLSSTQPRQSDASATCTIDHKQLDQFALQVYINLILYDEQQQENNNGYSRQSIEKYIHLSISFYIQYILYIHIKEDNTIHESIKSCDQKDIPLEQQRKKSSSQFLIPVIIQVFTLLLKVPSSSNALFSPVQSLLHAIISIDPQSVLHQIRTASINEDENGGITTKTSKIQQSKLLYYYPIKILSAEELHVLKPRELALYRKKQYMMKLNQKLRCRDHAIVFCKMKGLDILLRHAIFSGRGSDTATTNDEEDNVTRSDSYNNSYWRREIVITMSKVIHCFSQSNQNLMQKGNKEKNGDDSKAEGEDGYRLNDDDLKKCVVDIYFQISEQDLTGTSSSFHTLTIEEINDDSENSAVTIDHPGGSKSNDFSEGLKRTLERCILSTSMLLANGELGTWILRKAWPSSHVEWKNLVMNPLGDDYDSEVNGDYHICMSIASELASAAASVESARAWITSCAGNHADDNIYWKKLLSSESQDVRSGAASAMAKLGLSDKAISSDEGELFSLLEIAGGLIIAGRNESTSTTTQLSNSISQLEKGIELLSYLSSKTIIKDEIAHGFAIAYSSKDGDSEKSLLEQLVHLAAEETLSNGKDKMPPSVKYALSNIFSSLAVSIETLRREAFADKEITIEQYDQLQSMGKTQEEKELEESKVDQDTPEAVTARIENMTNKGVCNAIVNMIKNGVSEGTNEQLVICMMRMANEPSVRGRMIQDGCLTECQRISKIEKSNSSISESEKKIIQSAQHTIGKLLVTTNPALLSTSQRLGSVKPLLQLIKNSDSTDLQRFEALLSVTNLAGFDDETKNRIVAERGISVLSYAMFSDHEMVRRAATEAMSNLVPHNDVITYLRQSDKLKIFVAFASDFDMNYECARAACGCLAMISGDEEIAHQFCRLDNSRSMVEAILSSGKLELMHRILVLLLNLIGDEKQWIVSSGSLKFCEVYVQKYHNENFDGLGFTLSDIELMKTTIYIAQELVDRCS